MPMNTAKLLLLNVLGGSAADPFSPADIAGLALWLDASDGATLFQDSAGTTPATVDGDVVGKWADKSGNGRHATQATTASKPFLKLAVQNGRNEVLFDGSDDVLSATANISQPNTWFVAMNWVGGTGDFPFDGTDASRQTLYSVTPSMYAGTELVLPSPITGKIIWGLAFSGASSKAYKNGVEVASGDAGTQSLGTMRLGTGSAGNPSDAPIVHFYEVIIYGSILSASDRGLVFSYLNTRWGVY